MSFAVSESIVEAEATLNFRLLTSESALNAAVTVPPGNVDSEQQGLTAELGGVHPPRSGRPARRPRAAAAARAPEAASCGPCVRGPRAWGRFALCTARRFIQ